MLEGSLLLLFFVAVVPAAAAHVRLWLLQRINTLTPCPCTHPGNPHRFPACTLPLQIASDEVLQPLGRFAEQAGAAAYPATPAGRQVADELAMINLKAE